MYEKVCSNLKCSYHIVLIELVYRIDYSECYSFAPRCSQISCLHRSQLCRTRSTVTSSVSPSDSSGQLVPIRLSTPSWMNLREPQTDGSRYYR